MNHPLHRFYKNFLFLNFVRISVLFFQKLLACLFLTVPSVIAVFPAEDEHIQLSELKFNLIKHYFMLGYKYKEILVALICIHGIKISYTHLKRLLKQMDLRRKVVESPADSIIRAILKEISGSGRCLGYKTMWKRLKTLYGLHVRRSSVLRLMWLADPEGMNRRKAKRLLRRKYSCPGPNFSWHIDGYDKIKPFGFAIHGAVDGFSRKIVWLEVGPSNNDPKIISRYFLQTVKNIGCRVPTIIRSDMGTENTTVHQLQIYFRYRHDDEHAADKSFILGKSTSNQRIESMWSMLRRQCTDFWINLLKDMRDTNMYSDGDLFKRQCLLYCFTPIIRKELKQFSEEWNLHVISKSRTDGPRGKPEIMYTLPALYNTKSFCHRVNEDEVDVCMEIYSKQVDQLGCLPECHRLFQLLNPKMPATAEEAFDLYVDIISKIDDYL